MTYDYSLREISEQAKVSYGHVFREVTKARKKILGEDLTGYNNKRLKYRNMAKKKKPAKEIEVKDPIEIRVGVGDIIESFTEKTGIKKLVKIVAGEDCGCEERKKRLNELPIFYKQKLKPKCLDREEINSYGSFIKERTFKLLDNGKAEGKIEPKYIDFTCEFFAKVFNRPLWKPECYACRGTALILIKMIQQLDHVYYNELAQIEINKKVG